MDPTDPGGPSRRPRGWAGLGAILALGAVNKVVHRATTEPAAPEPAPPAPGASHHRLVRAVALGMVLALLVAGTLVVIDRTGDHGPPARWDPRVAALARFVEHRRGLRYDHAVRVDFLSDQAFRARVTDEGAPSRDDAASIHHYEGLFRALGLVEGKLDLAAAEKQLTGEGVIGLYVPGEDRIYVRGDRITPGMRPTIVHELTHALQAQHFQLRRRTTTSGEATAFTSLVEADAMRIEDAYVRSLSPAERKVVNAEQQREASGTDLAGVPQILTELFALPYVFGPPFVDALDAAGGQAAIDRAFRHPPSTEEHIIEPQSYLDHDLPAKVAPPTLGAGEKAVGHPDDFGMLSLLLVLGERLSFPDAWRAVVGWKGDASRDYRVGGRDCIRVRTELDTPTDVTELLGALRVWAAGRPWATTSSSGDVVELSSCDPGTATASNDATRPRTFEVLQLRSELVSSLEHGGLDHTSAECAADTVLRDHDPKQLLGVVAIDDPKDPRIVTLQRDVVGAVQSCRKTASPPARQR
jgi:hypothetical protein